jgi:hypothetical protein
MIFTNPHIYKQKPPLSENVFKKPQNPSKCPTLMKKTSIYLEIILKSLEFFEKASHYLKAQILMKISSKSFVVFIKASHILS